MEVPKFLVGDNTDMPEAIFVIHTEVPRFIIDLAEDSIEWLEEFDQEDMKSLEDEMTQCVAQASAFYDREVERYDSDD